MGVTFLDGQTVGGQDLNNIAIDLGSAEFSHFTQDAEPWAVNSLNNITADLVSKGILLTMENCAVSVVNNKLNIATGIIVFENGVKKRIMQAESVSLTTESDNYIYALHNEEENAVFIMNSTTEPIEGNFVMLAHVTSDGTLIDRRIISKAKYSPVSGSNVTEIRKFTNVSFKDEEKIKFADIDDNGIYNYILYERESREADYYRKYVDFSKINNDGTISTLTIKNPSFDNGCIIEIRRVGTKIELSSWKSFANGGDIVVSELSLIFV